MSDHAVNSDEFKMLTESIDLNKKKANLIKDPEDDDYTNLSYAAHKGNAVENTDQIVPVPLWRTNC